ncbi:hypothetical protein NKJ51_12505 [Mesorhizobium sp. M0134]|uniref:hypothetical protein n=1 Tax=Mesorhizobium sp. M0134 TaxID=2956889 RepID=UPI00333C6B3B
MSALLIVSATAVVSFVAGWVMAHDRIAKRQASRREFQIQLGNPLDLERCEFTSHWQVRS